jgi:chemotaxis response regulator CheB
MIAARSARFIETIAESVNKNPLTTMSGGAQDRDSAVERMVLLRPDVAIIDIDLGYELGGIDAAFALRKINPTRTRTGMVLCSYLYSPQARVACKGDSGFLMGHSVYRPTNRP